MGTMSALAVWIIVGLVVAELLIAPLLVRAVVGGVWGPLAGAYPARPPGEDSVRKDFQSYRLGIVNLGYSVHTTVDAEFLHLEPVRLLRLMGIRPLSVPWEDVTPIRSRGTRYADVKIGAQRLTGPRWALELAFAGGATPGEQRGGGPYA